MTSVSAGDRNCAPQIDKTLFDHSDTLGLEVPSSCGRMGTCHECVVEIREGANALSPATEAESFLRAKMKTYKRQSISKYSQVHRADL